jgi:hypothetical protein
VIGHLDEDDFTAVVLYRMTSGLACASAATGGDSRPVDAEILGCLDISYSIARL